MVKVLVIDKKISKRVLTGKGGKPLTGEIELDEKQAASFVKMGLVEYVEETVETEDSVIVEVLDPKKEDPKKEDPKKDDSEKDDSEKDDSEKDDSEKGTFESITAPFTEAIVELGVSTVEELNATETGVLETVHGIGPALSKEILEKAAELLKV